MKLPFCPDFCHVTDFNRLYWISHEEFEFVQETRTSGAPYTENFYTKNVHRVKKVENGVHINIIGSLIFVKDFAMKGMVKGKVEDEMKSSIQFQIDEIKKFCQLETGKSSGELPMGSRVLEEKDEPIVEETKSKGNKFGEPIKMPIWALILLVLGANLILKIIIG